MDYLLFADESGTSSVDKCFTIGCLLVPKDYLEEFEVQVNALITKHNLPRDRELKWQRVKKSYGMVNFLIDLTKLINNSRVSFICKVAWKQYYFNWHKNEEVAFYKSYTMLMTFCVRMLNSTIEAKIDNKSDSYRKHPEVVGIIANYNLKNRLGNIKGVNKCDSKTELLIQVADLFTGAINSSHNHYLNPSLAIHEGKLLAIRKIAECIGWDSLHYDTYPNSSINIWHFPEKEYRAYPKTMEVKINNSVQYITSEALN
ncbi:DUF3800 domain-containing protein [Vibrio cholerae]|nr:DUF3800 domain-containing protein [Vibrio cholerae]